jgi:hypothetical protein
LLKDIKAGITTCDGVPPVSRRGGNQGMGMQQQQSTQLETPFEVAYDYFHIVNKGLK